MGKALIPFGVACRTYRTRRSLVMADQAKHFRCSVSSISAIERGERSIPEGFADDFARWLELTDIEASQLRQLARQGRKNRGHRPFAGMPCETDGSEGNSANEELKAIREILSGVDANAGFSISDLQKLAARARACFELGNEFTFDLIHILENKLPEVDPEFYLQVTQQHHLPNQIAGYAQAVKSAVKSIVLSEYIYEWARQKPDPRFVAAHELGHWLLNQGGNFQTYPSDLQLEKDIDRFAREFLMPERTVRLFSSASQLSAACNVPLRQAQIRMDELGLTPRKDRDQISRGFAQLLSQLKKPESQTEQYVNRPKPDFRLIPFPPAPVRRRNKTRPARGRDSKSQSSVPLFEYIKQKPQREALDYYEMLDALGHIATGIPPMRPYGRTLQATPVEPKSNEPKQRVSNRAYDWFRLYGWR